VKLLIVRLGALGDIVHAVPVAVALRAAYPDAQIDWVVSAKHRPVLDLVSVLDRHIVVDDRGQGTGGLPMTAAIGELRRTGYDVAIDLQGLMKSALLARLSGASRVIGFTSRYARESLASLFYTERYDPGGPGLFAAGERRHVVQINLGILSQLGIEVAAPVFGLRAPQSVTVANAIARAGRWFALLNPGAAWPNKRWPAERFGALAPALRERHGLASIVLWGPGEHTLAEDVVNASGGYATLAPPTAIADVAALAGAAAVMVSGDTGPAHIASAMGTRFVGIYGPTRPERNGPLGHSDQVVSRAPVCECHHRRQCRRRSMCLLDIETDEVLDAIGRRLTAAGRPRG
jgi:heptosyltransferase-1